MDGYYKIYNTHALNSFHALALPQFSYILFLGSDLSLFCMQFECKRRLVWCVLLVELCILINLCIDTVFWGHSQHFSVFIILKRKIFFTFSAIGLCPLHSKQMLNILQNIAFLSLLCETYTPFCYWKLLLLKIDDHISGNITSAKSCLSTILSESGLVFILHP